MSQSIQEMDQVKFVQLEYLFTNFDPFLTTFVYNKC